MHHMEFIEPGTGWALTSDADLVTIQARIHWNEDSQGRITWIAGEAQFTGP